MVGAGNLVVQTRELLTESVGSQWDIILTIVSSSLASIVLKPQEETRGRDEERVRGWRLLCGVQIQ